MIIRWYGGWYADKDVMGQVLPRWLGEASRAWEWRGVLFLPIPLNLLYGWTAHLWWWARRGVANPSARIYDAGEREGHRVGYQAAHDYYNPRLTAAEELLVRVQQLIDAE